MLTLDRARRALRDHRPITDEAPEARPAAVALLLHEAKEGLETLFIRRAERAGDPWSGQVALPGGRREPEDADLLATALRETHEEIGVDLHAAERLGALNDLYPRTPVLPPVVVRPFVFVVPARPAVILSDEVTAAFWVPLTELGPATRRDVTLSIRGADRSFPAFVIGSDTIWGMTERIMTDFLQLLSG